MGPVVVRTGYCAPKDMAYSAWSCHTVKRTGVWGLSVWWWPNMTSEQIVMKARQDAAERGSQNPVLHSVMRAAPVSDFLGLDPHVEIYRSYKPGHATLSLPLPVPTFLPRDAEDAAYAAHRDWWDVLDLILSPPVTNPAKGKLP